MNSQKDLFNYFNKNNISYVVLRGFDNKSGQLGKDLDILIDKKDFFKVKQGIPSIDREVDFYIDEEKHGGIVFVSRKALLRRIFDHKRGFYRLHQKDKKKMDFWRSILKKIRVVKKSLGMYNQGAIAIVKRNFKLFGPKYVFWDLCYQIARRISRTKKHPLDKSLIKRKINNYEMLIYRQGKGIHRDLRLHGIREPISTKIMGEVLRRGDIVLDAGANIGYYSLLSSEKIGAKGGVYAVEPVRENFEILKKNIALNKVKNIRIFKRAFSDKNGKIEIYKSNEGNLNTPVKMRGLSRKEKVQGVTIDSFLKNKGKPSLIRMDVEGYEDFILRGAKKSLNSVRVIFVELHFPLLGKKRMVNLLNYLKKHGFEIDKAVLEWERWEEENTSLNKLVNYFHRKRSKPRIYSHLTIDKLIHAREFIEGHLSLEVFFKNKNDHLL